MDRLLRELSTLCFTLCDEVDDLVGSSADATPEGVHAVHRSLHREFARLEEMVARVYREAEAQERRQIAERLTNFGRALEHEIRGPLQKAAVAVERLKDADILKGS